MTEPTTDELARWADEHRPVSWGLCGYCEDEEWPCSVTRLLALVASQAEQIAELRAGEADADPKEGIIPTSAQWLRKYNRATPEKRLDVAAMVIEDGRTAMRCWEEDHPRVIAIWRDRAERAEAHLARVRALCDRIESEAGRRMFTDDVLSLAGAFRAALDGTEGDA